MYLPKVFSLKGAIGLPPYYDSFVKNGFWVETHYTILYLLGGTLAVKGFIVVMGLTAAFFAGKIARLCGAKTRGVIIVWFIIYTSSVFTGNFISGKTDAITCTLGLAAFFWLFETFDRQTVRRSILLGVLLAATILSKISYIPILGLGTAIIVIWSYIENNDQNQSISFYILICLIILLTMSLCFAPHLAKNAFLFNNALAPFNEQSMAQVWYNAINTAHILKSYPLAVCFGMYPMQAGTVSPLLLVCAPFLFYLKKDHVNGYIFNKVLVISILSILTWKILSPSMVAPRYIMASFFLLSACGVVAVEKYIVLQKRNHFLKVLVLLSLILSLVIVIPPTIKSAQLTCYHQKQVEFINEKAEKSATILLYGYYGFYLRDDLITNTYSGFILKNNKKSRFNQIIEIHPAYILVQSDGIDSFNKDFTMPENDYFKLVLADEGLNFKSYMVEWKK